MFKRSSITIHARGLIVLAIAATTLELLAVPGARAKSSRITDFEALYSPENRSAMPLARPRLSVPTCDAIDYDQSCGTMTGGPSGGNSDRN